MPQDKIYLIDGTSICYRSFFAIKLANSKGFPTGAVYGFYQTLKKIITQYKPSYMGVCFDVSRKTFRQEKFKAYKIQRPPVPDSLKLQMPVIKNLISALGIALIEKEGFEADDIIASFSRKATGEGLFSVIVSSDKDMFQLLEKDKVEVYDPTKDELVDEAKFKEEFRFSPQRIIDYLSLTGDSIDNVPGARGIGKATAAKLVNSFGSIENIFSRLDDLSLKIKEILLKEKENIFLSKELVELQNCGLDLHLQDLKIKEPDYAQIYKLFQELEFKSLLKSLPAPALSFKLNIEAAKQQDIANIAEEFIFSTDGIMTYFFDRNKNCVFTAEIEKIRAVLENPNIKKISYDFKEIMHLLKDGINNAWFDVKLAAYLIDSSSADYSLAALAARYLNEFLQEVPQESAPYFIHRLYGELFPKLKEAGLEELFFSVEMPLVDVLYNMESCGVRIDAAALEGLSKEIERRILALKENIFKISGREFNLNSPKQLAGILFEELKIAPLKKTKTGFSTNEEVLTKLAAEHNIAKLILDYRELNKLQTTYVLPLLQDTKLKGAKLHAEFNQTATSTGRLSSSSPNLQSIPVKGELSAKLRSAFISSFAGGYIVCADYSQIELRILAHFSADEKLLEAFAQNLDIHRYTAALLFGVKENAVDPKMRDLAKRVNFAILYGMSAYGLSQELNTDLQEAEVFINDYFLRYPKVKEYIQKVYKEVEENGFVTTILGRKRYLPDFKSPNPQLKEFAMRQAINTPIQGSCADLIKVAMVKLYREFNEKRLQSKLIMQIHDELVFDVCAEELKAVCEIAGRQMKRSIKLNVPIEVNIKYGKNWAELTEVDGRE